MYITSYFSLAGFKILSLSLTLDILIIICLDMGLSGSSDLELYGCPGSECLFPSVIICSSMFSAPLSLPSPSGTLLM